MISVSNLFRMQLIHFTAFITLCMSNVFAYHDPDLNYHLNQVQKLSNCDGYSYPAPSVQLAGGTIKGAQQLLPQPALSPAFQYSSGSGYAEGGSLYTLGGSGYAGSGSGFTASAAGNSASGNGYSGGVTYLAPKITYAPEPAATYQTSSLVPNYSTAPVYATKEAHGYTTSAGLSAQSSSQRTVTPLATYAQAPIIAKVTAAPLIARFTLAPGKNTYTVQNVISQQSIGSSAKASLNSYSNFQHGGPVVSQVFAAPSAGYATSPALRVQQPAQVLEQARYAAPTVAEYHKASAAANSAPANQYVTSSVTHSAPATQYFSPASQQYAPSASQYSAPAIQYSGPATQYSGPGVLYSTPTVQYSAPALKYSAPEIQYSAMALPQFSAPVSTQFAQQYNAHVNQFNALPTPALTVSGPVATHVAASPIKKNVHTEFLENYDSHPRYAYEYSVNDPHTGDIKQQKEQRDGEVVKGQYSLVEPDGSVRTVNYVADWETGFHADVRNSKDNQH